MLLTAPGIYWGLRFRDLAEGYNYHLANKIENAAAIPDGYDIPFNWQATLVPQSSEGLKLEWNPGTFPKNQSARLRIASATDGREITKLRARTARTGTDLGVLDVRFAIYMQPFELEIAPENLPKVLSEGIVLQQVEGKNPFYVFTRNENGKQAPTALLPHILTFNKENNKDAWKERLLSLESMQTFGWMHGCALDGIMELAQHSEKAKSALEQHLLMFFGDNQLHYAAYRNQNRTNQLSGVESLLPFAVLARTDPRHPALQLVIDFCEKHRNAQNVIADGQGDRSLKTEECYTVSYPLAVMARQLDRPELAEWAAQTLLARAELLHTPEYVYQRSKESGDERIYPDWGRGVAWYLLGLTKTITHLPDSPDRQKLLVAFQEAAAQVIADQRPNGLWYCFFDQPATGYETSGSAGVAAALAHGYQHGYLDKSARNAARKAKKGLQDYMTPDGFLTGSAQANKGGIALQTDGFRVIATYTLGFMAHLDTI